MIFRNRPLARLGAAALLASGAFTVLGTPAAADTGPTCRSTSRAPGSRRTRQGKVGFVKVANKGANTPTELSSRVDVSKLDSTKVGRHPRSRTSARRPGTSSRPTWLCALPRGADPGAG